MTANVYMQKGVCRGPLEQVEGIGTSSFLEKKRASFSEIWGLITRARKHYTFATNVISVSRKWLEIE